MLTHRMYIKNIMTSNTCNITNIFNFLKVIYKNTHDTYMSIGKTIYNIHVSMHIPSFGCITLNALLIVAEKNK